MTTPTVSGRRVTAAEYERLEDRRAFEIVGSELVERHVSFFSAETAASFIGAMGPFVRRNRLGRLFDSEAGIRIHPGDPLHTRRADVGFISYERSPQSDTGYLRIAPELVIEVVSPGDTSQEVRNKVDEWLAHGVRMVWVAFPRVKEIHVYARDQHPGIFTADDTIAGVEFLPGFELRVAEFFPPE